jgi:hypothetical protein
MLGPILVQVSDAWSNLSNTSAFHMLGASTSGECCHSDHVAQHKAQLYVPRDTNMSMGVMRSSEHCKGCGLGARDVALCAKAAFAPWCTAASTSCDVSSS